MKRVENPFCPGAGTPPPELVGRDTIIEQAEVLLHRVKNKRSEKCLMLIGLRGVGKTVLINDIERMARENEYHTVNLEAYDGKPFGILIAPLLRSLLFEIDRVAGIGRGVRRALSVLASFASKLKITVNETFTIGLDIEPEIGTADSGDLEIDLPDLFIAIGEAAQERRRGVAILVDEIQYLDKKELGALIMALHKIQQRRLPVVLVAAGLPTLPGLAGNAKSYAERLFQFYDVGALDRKETARALQGPVEREGASFEAAAIERIFDLTKGYPYFVQEWGYRAWNSAPSSPISLAVIETTTSEVIDQLDKNFFRVRFERLTPSEKTFLRAMAELGIGPYRSSDVAGILQCKLSAIGPVRMKLIRKGMIYSPAYGDIDFTVPLFNEFMVRTIPSFKS
jgi:AAA ATPase domain